MSLTSLVDREQAKIHFLNHARHPFHAIYLGEEILGVGEERVRAEIERCAHARLQRLVVAGRLLQSHFSSDCTFGLTGERRVARRR
ncbi:hypothetical protein AMES_2321 [Amycolatopsis mediterranei S699]|uniref:Uncharacterized protein n=2 Tax=Amycolatopsis mediterranei TaxID=33910 RepID=A0A0H3CZQ8_AMYMU|nr:hypothetical protein [Amycolatopsis mediterranei]ADJ44144.1 hypothetical protein AMED_2347 [Amycolatopsis mediterranei U32]AEK40878.1 hypothetical protein RAM_11940 [Amycolatopsis mediterranei S699]AFO75857.1 hypothetical protein AMES_2321 [Amycolatopsis mediterranei S699]AGT82986.1 hypothetical protein B737_2322 [Amycolatopsis mediterranei RB]KDO06938.1 hypothetical protein DV26_32585 [Amycolatopsis mediterranei]